MAYRKHFIPLESNPELFTELVRRLGLADNLAFHDVLSLEDAELLALVPRPAFALVLVFPAPPGYDAEIAERDKNLQEYVKSGDEEDAMWFKQTIHNACGLYGILHAVSNGEARSRIGSHLAGLLATSGPLQPLDRAAILEDDEQLEAVYKMVALQGDTEAPDNPEDEVYYHYVCFVKSHKNGHLYELDGDRKDGPVDWGLLREDEDMLSEAALTAVQTFVRSRARDVGFSLLALAPEA